jgi:SAM-dependent methyltransferase
MSRYLAGLGAEVTGVDISAAMLGKARAAGPADISYLHADDLAGTLSSVATVLRPGGWFAASIVHPCFPGNERGRSSWPPGDGYESEGWWTSSEHNPDGARIRVGATHRKLSTVLNALLDAGLAAERFVEPPAPVPTFLLWRCRRR